MVAAGNRFARHLQERPGSFTYHVSAGRPLGRLPGHAARAAAGGAHRPVVRLPGVHAAARATRPTAATSTRPKARVSISSSTPGGDRHRVGRPGDATRAAPVAGRRRHLHRHSVVSGDDGYRVEADRPDGLQTGDPRYFVRMLDDRPPEVRIVRPAGDRQVTPLEEVEVEARADDDHGVQGLELVYGVAGGARRVVPLGGDGATLSVTGHHTIPLEELRVRARRLRDVLRPRARHRPRQAIDRVAQRHLLPRGDAVRGRVRARAEPGDGGGGGQSGDDLVRLQKEIIIGTWKLDRRVRRPASAADVGRWHARRRRCASEPRRGQPAAAGSRGTRRRPRRGRRRGPDTPLASAAPPWRGPSRRCWLRRRAPRVAARDGGAQLPAAGAERGGSARSRGSSGRRRRRNRAQQDSRRCSTAS